MSAGIQESACLLQTREPLSSVGQSSLVDIKDCNLRSAGLYIILVEIVPACIPSITKCA